MDAAAGSIMFRPSDPEDHAFLQSSWASSYYKGSNAHKYLSPTDFHAFHRPLRDRFFAKPNTAVIVCTPDDDRWLILGWIAVEKIDAGLILQYLYVKSAFKGQGIAAELIKRAIPTTPVFYTHMTERASRIMSKKSAQFQGFRHIPHLI